MKSLEGRVAVVAGATRGAGRGIARMLGVGSAAVVNEVARRGAKLPTWARLAGRCNPISGTRKRFTSARARLRTR